MATNPTDLNDVNEGTVAMDVGELSTTDEEGQHQSLSHGFTGPIFLSGCIHFIMLNAIINLVNEHIGVYLKEIFQTLLSHDTILDNQLVRLQEFANKFVLHLYVCIINQSGIEFRHLSTTSVQKNGNSSRAFLVLDERNGNYYPFYAYDKKHREQTVFPMNDTYTMRLFEDLAASNHCSGHFQIVQQSPNQDKSLADQRDDEEANAAITTTTYGNPPTVNTVTISENVDVLPKKLKSMDTNKDNTKEISLNVEDRAISRVRAPKDEDAGTFTNASIVTEPFLPSDSRFTTTKNIDLLPKLKLLNQATRFRKNREVKTVGKGCPTVQVEGAPQRTPMLLKLPEEIRNSQEQFYIGIHTKRYNGNDHAQTRVAPKIKKAKKNHRSKSGKQDDDPDEFDFTSNGVFSKINQDDLNTLEKKITVLMFNLKQNEEITKDLILKDKLIWCRLMFAIYIKSSNGGYECVSPPVYSDLIEHTHGPQSLVFEKVFPIQFCECGGQIIFIQLNALVEKCDLYIRCNGRVLDQYDYQIAKTVLSFETPARLPDENRLHIIIYNKKTKDQIVVEPQYRSHDDHPEPCGVINKD